MTDHHAVLKALLAMIGDPALVAGPDGAVIAANEAFRSLLDVQPGCLLSAMIRGGLPTFASGSAESVAIVQPEGATYSLVRAGMLRVILNSDGVRVGYSLTLARKPVTSRDVARQFRILKLIVEQVPNGIAIWDEEDKLYLANSVLKQRYSAYGIELRRGSLRGPILEAAGRAGLFGAIFVDGEDFPHLQKEPCAIERVPGTSSSTTNRLGFDNWLRISAQVLSNRWLLSVYEDVRTSGDLDAEKADLAEYYGRLLQYVPDLIVHVGGDRIEFVNAAFARLAGAHEYELVGLPADRFFSDTLGLPMEELLKSVTPENSVFSFEQRWEKPGGEFIWLRWSAHAFFVGGKLTGLVATGRDITIEYRQQADLRHQSEELAKKNKSLEQFAGVVSHDLKAPLRHVSVFADMIVEEAKKGNLAEVMNYAGHVRQSAQRMDRVVRRLLEYSQIAYKIMSIRRVNLADAALQAIQNLETQIEEARAEILLSKLPVIQGDPDLMRHLMQNLIANAVKYRRTGAVPKIRIYSTEFGSSFDIIVEDNGIGIDPKFAGTIFNAFQRLHKDDKVYEGFGIGLALCRQIAESHQGGISLDAGYKTGARFVVTLPRQLKYVEPAIG